MSEDEIVIERGLPEAMREAAVIIFEEAFGEKMRMIVGDRDKRMALMGRAYDANHVIAAVRDDELLGMAGLSSREGAYRGGPMDVSWDPRPYRDLLGLWGAMWAAWNLRLGSHRPKPDELYVDGIAVSPAARGQGIGARLMREVVVIARENGLRWVRLDVADINPRAQALYERLGYRVTRVQSFRYKQRWTGFGAMISMELPVGDRS